MDDDCGFRLAVPAAGLLWLTENQRLHWAERNQRIRGWRFATYVAARKAKLPRLDRARIECELLFTDVRRRDPGNWSPTAKACVDGLVDAGVFDDDDYTRVVGPDMRIGPKVTPAKRGVVLHIHPLERLL